MEIHNVSGRHGRICVLLMMVHRRNRFKFYVNNFWIAAAIRDKVGTYSGMADATQLYRVSIGDRDIDKGYIIDFSSGLIDELAVWR